MTDPRTAGDSSVSTQPDPAVSNIEQKGSGACADFVVPASAATPKEQLNIMTFNVRYSNYDEHPNKTSEQMAKLADIIKAESLDIVFLQEFENRSMVSNEKFMCADAFSVQHNTSACCVPTKEEGTPFTSGNKNTLQFLMTNLKAIGYPMHYATANYDRSIITDPRGSDAHQYLVTLSRFAFTSITPHDIGERRTILQTNITIGSKNLALYNLHLHGSTKSDWTKLFDLYSPGRKLAYNVVAAGDWNMDATLIDRVKSQYDTDVYFAGNMLDAFMVRKPTPSSGMVIQKASIHARGEIQEEPMHTPTIGTLDISRASP